MVLSQTLSLQWMGNVFAHLVRLPTSFFEKRHLGDITSRFGAVNAIQKTLTTAAIEAVLDGLMAVAALVMMLIYAPHADGRHRGGRRGGLRLAALGHVRGRCATRRPSAW